MSRPVFTAPLINELRERVARHNDHAPTHARVRLADVKKRYSSWHQGESPHQEALAKIDGWLLEKATGFDPTKHPRARGGKFSGKNGGSSSPPPSPLPAQLPQTEEEHRKLQATNPSYRALTSDIIPDQRHVLLGAAARVAGSIGLGTALAIGAYRGKSGDAIARAFAAGGGKLGRVVGGAAGYGAARGTAMAAHKLASAVAKARGKPASAASFKRADLVGKKVADLGEKIGRVPGQVVGKIPSGTLRGAVRLAHKQLAPDSEGATQAQRVATRFRRAALTTGIVGGAGVAAGLSIDGAIKGSLVDPEGLGRAYDYDSYRTIEKLAKADGIDLQEAYEAISASLRESFDASGGVLEKSAASFFHGTAAKILGTTAAAAVGATAAGAAGYGAARLVGRGDPYRDSHGRFASRANAVAGGAAIAGGIAAAAAAIAAIHGHNSARFVQVARDVIARSAARSKAIETAQVSNGRVLTDNGLSLPKQGSAWRTPAADLHEALAGRQAAIEKAMTNDAGYKQALAELDRYGSSATSHYKEMVRDDVNGQLASVLASIDNFRLPKTNKSPARTVAEIRSAQRATTHLYSRAANQAPVDEVKDAIARMSPAEFKDSIKDLTDKQREPVESLFNRRQELVDGVDDQLAAHHKKLADASDGVSRAEEALIAAKNAEGEANARKLVAAEADHPAALKAVNDAADATAKAEEALKKARAAHEKLKGAPKVTYPAGTPGRAIPGLDVTSRRTFLRSTAETRATKTVDDKIANLRLAALAHEQRRHERLLAAVANFGAGAAPRGLRAATKAMNEARDGDLRAIEAHEAATAAHKSASELAADARAASEGRIVISPKHRAELTGQAQLEHDTEVAAAAKTGKKIKRAGPRAVNWAKVEPNDADRLHTADLITRKASIEAAAKTAKDEVNHAAAKRIQARNDLSSARTVFNMAMADAGKGHPRRVPLIVGARLSRSYRQVFPGARHVWSKFLASPTGSNLSAFAAWAKAHAKGGYQNVKTVGKQSVHHLFMRDSSVPGAPPAIDFMKSIGSVSLLAGTGALGEFGHDLYGYAKTKIAGKPEDKAKAKFPRQIKYDEYKDPFSGAGWRTVSIPDPENKGDRIVLSGEQFDGPTAKSNPIYAGSKLSSVRAIYAIRQAQGRPGGAGSREPGPVDLANLKEQDKNAINGAIGQMRGAQKLRRLDLPGGGVMEFRHEADTDHDAAANKLYEDIKIAQGAEPPQKRAYYDKLVKLLYSKQSPVLKSSQAYGLLTGYRDNGSKLAAPGIFKPNEAFGSSDKGQIASALSSEVSRAIDVHQLYDETQRAALLRAVALVGHQKGLDGGALKDIRGKILSAQTRQGGVPSAPARPLQGVPGGVTQRPSQPAPQATGRLTPDIDVRTGGKDWDRGALRAAAEHVGRGIALDALGYKSQKDVPHVAAFVEMAARAVNAGYPELDMHQSLAVVHKMVMRESAGGEGTRENLRDAIHDKDGIEVVLKLLNDEAERAVSRLNKMDGTDILETLEKGFLDTLRSAFQEARVPAGGPGGGEFTSGGAQHNSGMQAVGREVSEGTSDALAQNQKGDNPGGGGAGQGRTRGAVKAQPFYAPSRLIPEIGSYLVGDAASLATAGVLGPEGKVGALTLRAIAPSLLGESGGAAAATAARWALKGAAGNVAATKATAAARPALNAAGKALTGKAAVAPDLSGGQEAASLLGNVGGGFAGAKYGEVAGGAIGGAVAGPVGAGVGVLAGKYLGGSLGAYAGGHLATGAYDAIAGAAKWFAGYDEGQARAVMQRYAGDAVAQQPNLRGALPRRPNPDDTAPTPTLRPRGITPGGLL